MKILYLCDDFPPESLGGAGVIVHNLAVRLKMLGHEIYVITTTRNKQNEGFHDQEGINVFRIYSNYHPRWRAYISLYNPQCVRKIAKLITEFGPDVIHAHHVHQYLSYHSLKLAKRYGKKLVMTFHDTMCYSYGKVADESKRRFGQDLQYRFRYNPFRNIFIKHYIKKCVDVKIAVSNALQRALQNNGFKNVVVIHNGIDIRTWTVSDQEKKEFIMTHNFLNKKSVLFGGRLSGAKGGEKIVSAMAIISKKLSDVVLLIAGSEDGYAAVMKEKAKNLNIIDKIIFLGWLGRNEIKLAYCASDVVVVPSTYLDPFPTVNLEAMAAKKPVVTTQFGGSSEVVIDGETGYVVDPNNTDELSQKIMTLLVSNQGSEFGRKGYERIKNFFGIDKQVSEHLQIYTH